MLCFWKIARKAALPSKPAVHTLSLQMLLPQRNEFLTKGERERGQGEEEEIWEAKLII